MSSNKVSSLLEKMDDAAIQKYLQDVERESLNRQAETDERLKDFSESQIKAEWQELIDKGFHFLDPESKPKPLYKQMAEYFKQVLHCKISGGQHYIYEDGHYKRVDHQAMRAKIYKLAQEKNAPCVERFYKEIELTCFVEEINDLRRMTDGYLNFNNGILDVRNNKLIPHSPMFFFTYKLPHSYLKDSSEPKVWLKFLSDVFDGDMERIEATREIFAYLMMGGRPFLHKAIVLYGSGRNGKSTYLEVLHSLLGANNITHVPLERLSEPFTAKDLDGKLVNLLSEIPITKLDSGIFKTAIGGEMIRGSYKGKDEFIFPCNCRFIFACNKMPVFADATTGLVEKFYFMPFNVYIPAHRRDPNILDKLVVELPNIAKWAADGVKRLMDRQRLPEIKSQKQAFQEFNEEVDSVYWWIKEFLDVDEECEDVIPSKILWQEYKKDCREVGRHPVALAEFSRRFANHVKQNLIDLFYSNAHNQECDRWCDSVTDAPRLCHPQYSRTRKYRGYRFLAYCGESSYMVRKC